MNEAQHPAGAARTIEMDEGDLTARARAGDREAFATLVLRYAGPARRIARAILLDAEDAEDAAQDGFLAALKGLERYDSTRPFGPWLLRIVANAASDRRRRRRVRATEPLPETAPSTRAGPDRLTERGALRESLRAALATLPARQRIAVVMFDVEGYSHRDIAGVLGVAEGTVRSDVFHARRALRAALGAWQDSQEDAG
jgi:RNA polymerase sigma-70 factor (ECF subfamily)